jgi:transcriptional regulator with XRE-family HTH domain
MARVNFTKKDAHALCRMRKAREMTQYELAEALGWPRSKIKRLEKHEVKSIEENDLAAIMGMLNAPKPSGGKPKADKGRPKPRLDYKFGTAKVLEALHDARARGEGFLRRGQLEAVTGFTAVQVRTFCKALEAEGKLLREGVGRGMKYVPLGRTRRPEGTPPRIPVGPRSAERVRKILDQAHRASTTEVLLLVLREQVKFPDWLLTLLAHEGLDDLTIRDVWGSAAKVRARAR